MRITPRVKELAVLVTAVGAVGAFLVGASRNAGFTTHTTGARLDTLEYRVTSLISRLASQDEVNRRLQVWMCINDYQSAVLAGVPCAALGVDRLTSRNP